MLGERIRHFRIVKGWRQDELAEKLFVSRSYVSALEKGHKTPSLPCVLKLIDLLDCSPNDLFEYDGNKNRQSETDDSVFRISDKTIASTLDLMKSLPPEENFKIYSYAKDLEQLYKLKSAN